jgi:hypothetical protein
MSELTGGELEAKDIVEACALPDATLRQKIDQLETAMKASGQTIEIPTTHHFAKGTYAREIFIPKGTLLTGKIHKTEHLNIISQGDISVLTEHGPKRIKAPFTMVSPPGTKRVGFAHEDTVWTTIHGTEETELDKLEEHLIATDYDDGLGIIELTKEALPCLG